MYQVWSNPFGPVNLLYKLYKFTYGLTSSKYYSNNEGKC